MKSTVLARLMPLYAASFFEGLMFWYAIEKVFMVHIGFSASSIAAAAVVLCLSGVAFDVPSGIIADRTSRKGMLMGACGALGLATWMLGSSRTVVQYILAGILYAAYSSLSSGMWDAMVYDTLMEEQHSRAGFERYLGTIKAVGGVAMVIGSMLGALIAAHFGLRTTYFISIPAAFLAVISLLVFREPRLHLKGSNGDITDHLKRTARQVFSRGHMRWVLMAILFAAVVFDFLLEVDQLWPLALHLPLVLYGPLNALLLLGYSLGGPLAQLLVPSRARIIAACACGLVCVALLGVPSMPIIALAQVGTISLFVALYTLGLGKLHDALPSTMRASASSITSMISSLIFAPAVFLFGWVTQQQSVFVAARLLLPLAGLSVLGILVLAGPGRWSSKPSAPTRRTIPNPVAP